MYIRDSVYSMGKTLHNTGWKIGYTVAREYLTNEIRKLHQFTVFSVNTPSQMAIARFMKNEPKDVYKRQVLKHCLINNKTSEFRYWSRCV